MKGDDSAAICFPLTCEKAAAEATKERTIASFMVILCSVYTTRI